VIERLAGASRASARVILIGLRVRFEAKDGSATQGSLRGIRGTDANVTVGDKRVSIDLLKLKSASRLDKP